MAARVRGRSLGARGQASQPAHRRPLSLSLKRARARSRTCLPPPTFFPSPAAPRAHWTETPPTERSAPSDWPGGFSSSPFFNRRPPPPTPTVVAFFSLSASPPPPSKHTPRSPQYRPTDRPAGEKKKASGKARRAGEETSPGGERLTKRRLGRRRRPRFSPRLPRLRLPSGTATAWRKEATPAGRPRCFVRRKPERCLLLRGGRSEELPSAEGRKEGGGWRRRSPS